MTTTAPFLVQSWTSTTRSHDTDSVPLLHERATVWVELGDVWPDAPAFLNRPAHRSDLPAEPAAHRGTPEPLTVRSVLRRILAACFGPAPIV